MEAAAKGLEAALAVCQGLLGAISEGEERQPPAVASAHVEEVRGQLHGSTVRLGGPGAQCDPNCYGASQALKLMREVASNLSKATADFEEELHDQERVKEVNCSCSRAPSTVPHRMGGRGKARKAHSGKRSRPPCHGGLACF